MQPLNPVSLDELRAASERLAGIALHTPLVRLYHDGASPEIYLKLENLQPIGSFKLRGAANAMQKLDRDKLAQGVWTASAGNMAQGVAWNAGKLGIPCTVVVPDTAPTTKLEALRRLGAKIKRTSFDEWLEVFRTRKCEGLTGPFIHAFSDPDVMAGNGTIGLEVLEELPDVEAVIIPYGGGGLSCGIASALRAVRPDVKAYACEVETAAPLAPSLAAGEPVEVEYIRTFVDGIGAPYLFREMWELARQLLDGSLVVSPREIADAIILLAERNQVIAEGAGAAPVAAALSGKIDAEKIVCVVSGGNIDRDRLASILLGKTP